MRLSNRSKMGLVKIGMLEYYLVSLGKLKKGVLDIAIDELHRIQTCINEPASAQGRVAEVGIGDRNRIEITQIRRRSDKPAS